MLRNRRSTCGSAAVTLRLALHPTFIGGERADFNDPWAVSIGDTNFVVFDSANASKSAYSPPAFEPYTTELSEASVLATPNLLNIWAVHHPVLGYSAASPPTSGNGGLQSVMNAAYPGNYYPANIGIAVHGHVHDFQALDFSSNHPATFVAGNGGDNLDTALPATFNPNGDLPALSVAIAVGGGALFVARLSR